MDYEGRICRAPMEKSSFMLPVMVGCDYNRCKFCGLFKHLKYRLLPLEQIEEELKRVHEIGGTPKKIFLGDGNAFGLKTEHLLEIIDMIHSYFPDCYCINMDATVTSIRNKTDEELKTLYEHGVRHLYLGIESGLDDVLKFMNKDHSLAEAYTEIERLHKYGLIFDAHIMNGVAGAGRGQENAKAVAEFFNRTHPEHICNFTIFIGPNSRDLWPDVLAGKFTPASELENLQEDRTLLDLLEVPEGQKIVYDSFHETIETRIRGILPDDKEKLLAKLDQILASPEASEYADL